jgi:hypothetical protein
MRKTFPNGVCDYSKPGVGQQPSVPWQTYAYGPGGRALGPAPVSTPLPAPVPAPTGPVPLRACHARSAFLSAGVSLVGHRRHVRVKFARRAPSPVRVDIVRDTRSGARVVRSFKKVVRPFVWNGRTRNGIYVVRLRLRGAVRSFALVRAHGRFARRPAIERVVECRLLEVLRLDRAAAAGALGLTYRVRKAASVGVTVLRGRHVVRRLRARPVTAGRHRLRLRLAGLPRGALRIRLTAVAGGTRVRATVTGRHL